MLLVSKKILSFGQGILWGIILASVGIVIHYGFAALINDFYQWLVINLGISAIVFVLILILYTYIWQRIKQSLKVLDSDHWRHIVHDEQLLDMLTGLAFGVGVIWTAIGMREALMAAFGDNEMSGLASQGALAMLDQLINGGILTALTSTVVGGIMGYVLRIIKTLTLMRPISDYQDQLEKNIASQVKHKALSC